MFAALLWESQPQKTSSGRDRFQGSLGLTRELTGLRVSKCPLLRYS